MLEDHGPPTTYRVRGAGGLFGGSTPAPPKNAEDTLRSEARVRVIDVIGEGPISGLVNGAKSIFFDDTPLLNEDDTENFPDVEWGLRIGTPDQDWMPGFPSSENAIGVGTKVEFGTPVVQTITNPDVDGARVTIRLPSLWIQNDEGALKEHTIQFKIEHKRQADSSWIAYGTGTETLTGKTMGGYEQDYFILFRPPGSIQVGPWQVRVTRLTDDAADPAKESSELYFQTLTATIEAKLMMPDTAYAGLEATASSFGGRVPTRSFHVRGLIVRVPVNYNPTTRVYSGIWNGTWKSAYTNNPAWCLLDLLTSTRYGAGIPLDKIDVATLYVIAKYCDEFIDDGRGGTEPRYALNVVINSRQQAFNLINKLVSSFMGMPYYGSGGVFVSQDSPRDPDIAVNNTNVQEGRFDYETASESGRHNVALISYIDNSDHGKPGIEIFELEADISRRGAKPTDLETFGVTSRGHAKRMGRWALYTERFEDETITYRAGLDHMDVVPGMIVEVFDRKRNPNISGGRVIHQDGEFVTLDREVTMDPMEDYVLVFLNSAKERVEMDVVGTYAAPLPTVTEGSYYGELLTITGTGTPGATIDLELYLPGELEATEDLEVSRTIIELNGVPDMLPGTVWALKGGASTPTYWRVITKQYVDAHVYEIAALRTDLNKHALIESAFSFDDGDTFPTQPSDTIPPAPTNIAAKEHTIQIPGAQDRIAVDITVEVPLNPLIKGVELQWYQNEGNWQDIVLTTQWGVTIVDLAVGTLNVRARTSSISGVRSEWYEAQFDITGRVIPPLDPTDLNVVALDFAILVTWVDPPEPSLKWTEVWRGTAPDFFDATLQGTSTTGSFQDLNTAASTVYYYWVRSRIFADPMDLFSNFVGPVSINSNEVAVNALVQGLQDAIDDISHDLEVGLLTASLEGLESYFRDQEEAFTRASESHVLNVGTEAAFARVEQEREVRITENAALASSIDAVAVQLQGIDGTIEAFVQEERVARIAEDDALAAQLTSVGASVGDLSAQGAFKMQASVAPGGVQARIAAMVKAGTMTDFATAGWYLDVISNGVGSWTRRFAVDVDQFAVTNSSLSITPFAIIGGVARLNLVRIADYIASDNYAEANNGDPISGWKLDKTGTLKAVDGVFGGATSTYRPFYTRHPTFRNGVPDTTVVMKKRTRRFNNSGVPVEVTRSPDQVTISATVIGSSLETVSGGGGGQYVETTLEVLYGQTSLPPNALFASVSAGRVDQAPVATVDDNGLLGTMVVMSQLEIDPLNIRNVTKSIGKLGWSGMILSIRVPAGRSRLRAKLWGAGGAGVNDGPTGGPGGYATAIIPVTPLEMLYAIIGEGGMRGLANYPAGFGGRGVADDDYGSAGGLTGIFRNTVDKVGALLIAGGGGCGSNNNRGGPGGAAASGGNGVSGTTVEAMRGLNAVQGSTRNEAGGGGYQGGGRFTAVSSRAAGKGGSSFAASGLTSVTLTSSAVTGVGYATDRPPPNTSDSDYVSYASYGTDGPLAGYGGKSELPEYGAGGHGLMVLEWLT